jgi:hypothetical protein
MRASWFLIPIGSTYIATGTIYSKREDLGTNPENLVHIFSQISASIMEKKGLLMLKYKYTMIYILLMRLGLVCIFFLDI